MSFKLNRLKVEYPSCPHCDKKGGIGHVWEYELDMTFVCGNCQIGKMKGLRILEEYEVH